MQPRNTRCSFGDASRMIFVRQQSRGGHSVSGVASWPEFDATMNTIAQRLDDVQVWYDRGVNLFA